MTYIPFFFSDLDHTADVQYVCFIFIRKVTFQIYVEISPLHTFIMHSYIMPEIPP